MAPAGVIDALTLPARREATEPPEARGLRRDEVRLLVSHVDTDSVLIRGSESCRSGWPRAIFWSSTPAAR